MKTHGSSSSLEECPVPVSPIHSAGEDTHSVPDFSDNFKVSSSSSVFCTQRMIK